MKCGRVTSFMDFHERRTAWGNCCQLQWIHPCVLHCNINTSTGSLRIMPGMKVIINTLALAFISHSLQRYSWVVLWDRGPEISSDKLLMRLEVQLSGSCWKIFETHLGICSRLSWGTGCLPYYGHKPPHEVNWNVANTTTSNWNPQNCAKNWNRSSYKNSSQ